ncbi:hypothetical protein FB548_0842 [Pseudoxanthomonas sp. 3HH-4]|uniref:hypothetical protein n=1 Tax=Pseudoxanthomonas sp. 3HH-4 TaxID=1690214 RepID=UPI0011514852|nr:hypothetical protein [Pseudoxanthomonas sp. 3HH-4]TQM17458.1 hypothetical protein FB548_0842 [Pseudoxanthomonas sp. 3HH-4]
MKGRVNKSLCYCALAALLLGACSKTPESPVAKTNPNPTQRYEITVGLVDPPADIKRISGEAHFSIPDVACMPTPDRIAGYTPGSSYIKNFSLTYAGGNTYKGHIFLDWPVDEDYYGLGVCKWEINTVGAVIDFGGYMQKPVLWGGTDFPSAGRKWWCRRPDSQRIIENCTSPSDPEKIELESRDSWLVILSAHRK